MSDVHGDRACPAISLSSKGFDVDEENAKQEWVSVDLTEFHQRMLNDQMSGSFDPETTHQNIASRTPVIVEETTLAALSETVAAIYQVIRTPAYAEHVLRDAPSIAQSAYAARGVLMGFDFHLTPDGPKLIEINTNAGGALINAGLLLSQKTCCPAIEQTIRDADIGQTATDRIVASFLAEWRAFGGGEARPNLVIVDELPEQQYLYPELVLFRELFRRHGIKAEIGSPDELVFRDGRLLHNGTPVDLVYNRVTDFYFDAPQNRPLRDAYLSRNVLVTPNPHLHALMANKGNLFTLSDPDALRAMKIPEHAISILTRSVPYTVHVTPDNVDRLWHDRKGYFFKPVAGYGSRGAYRGAKVTKRVWETISGGGYIAQAFVAPSVSTVKVDGIPTEMKVDLRAYVYDGEIQLLAARRYQGQTTNMRTAGGGFASVFSAVS